MAIKKAADKEEAISVISVQYGVVRCRVLGLTPLICNRMSEKATRQILMPPQKKNAADKASTLKHEPLSEYRASPYTFADESSPTLIAAVSTMFKGALRSVAIDIPGAAKAQIGRLTYVEGTHCPIWGVPQLSMMIVRSADINKTPDVRTRAIIPQWASEVTIKFVEPILRASEVVKLFAAAGLMRGVGDFRPEKGAGNYGQFQLVEADDKEWANIVEKGGRKAQQEAMQNPRYFDQDTEDLMAWFDSETKRRGFKVAA